MATSDDVWARFNQGGTLTADVVSRHEAEEMSQRVAELEDEVRAASQQVPPPLRMKPCEKFCPLPWAAPFITTLGHLLCELDNKPALYARETPQPLLADTIFLHKSLSHIRDRAGRSNQIRLPEEDPFAAY